MKILLAPIENLIVSMDKVNNIQVRNSTRFTLTQAKGATYQGERDEIAGTGDLWIAAYKGRDLFQFIKGKEEYDNRIVTKLYFKPGILKPRGVNREFLELITGYPALAEAILLLHEQEKFEPDKFTRITVL